MLEQRGGHPGLVHITSPMEVCDSYRPWHEKASGKTGATVGAGVAGQTGSNVRMYIALKTWDQRVRAPLRSTLRGSAQFAAVSGGAAFLQAAQDIRVGARLTKTEFQYTLQNADFAELVRPPPPKWTR